ncbi:MAG: 5-formyltetrahydrofolate cyclo-ligase [Clostridiales bacterium]|nr:5-formyltetrahydrofolate cyclo-ligase [Clostridiales bacterium]
MSTTTTEEKRRLRETIHALERSLSPETLRESDRQLFRRLMALPQVSGSNVLLLFWGMGREPDTQQLFAPLTAAGKTVLLPRCLPEGEMELRAWQGRERAVRHPYGMWEPSEACPLFGADSVDLVLVPALCYDRAGFRLGRGGGFYDRFLARCTGFSVGLCRQEFLQDRVPRENHDLCVDLVLTEAQSFSHSSPVQ